MYAGTWGDGRNWLSRQDDLFALVWEIRWHRVVLGRQPGPRDLASWPRSPTVAFDTTTDHPLNGSTDPPPCSSSRQIFLVRRTVATARRRLLVRAPRVSMSLLVTPSSPSPQHVGYSSRKDVRSSAESLGNPCCTLATGSPVPRRPRSRKLMFHHPRFSLLLRGMHSTGLIFSIL